MISVEHLSISYGGEELFSDVSFSVNKKERLGLVGRNGSGKTTLLQLLIGEKTPDAGKILISKGYKVGYLSQHIHFSSNRVIDEACLGLEEDKDQKYLAEKILFGLGFKKEDMEKSPEVLSGGYYLRLHLAKLLLSKSDCLLLDEPTNYLDILSLRFLSRFLQRWNGELILISHDREFMDSITTHTLGIHRKKIYKFKGSSIDFYAEMLLREEVHERNRESQEKKRKHLQSYIDRFGAKATKASQAASRKKMLERIPALEELKNLEELDFHFKEAPFFGKKMVAAEDIAFSYGKGPIIQGFSLEIDAKDRVAIIGKNGNGKSTLLRLLAKDLTPASGEIKFFEGLNIGYFGQTNIERLDKDKTVEEEIQSSNERLSYGEIKNICAMMLFKKDKALKKISVLSGGEKSRVLLGKILAKPVNFLLLDEPTQHLDLESIEALIDALEEFKSSFVVVTHSELILKRLNFKKLVICHAGRQELFNGDYNEFLEKVGWEEEKSIEKKERIKEPRKNESKVLEKEIKNVEQKIIALEEVQDKEYKLLIEASSKNDIPSILSLNKSTKERTEEIQQLYEKFSSLSQEMEKKSKN